MAPKLVVLALGLAALANLSDTASAADVPATHGGCKPVKFRCGGSEPFWRFNLSNKKISFYDAENPNGATAPVVRNACAKPIGGGRFKITASATLNLTATIKPQSCTEESGATRPYSISISYRQGALTNHPMQISGMGCCRK